LPTAAWEGDGGGSNLLLGCSAKATCQERAYLKDYKETRIDRLDARHRPSAHSQVSAGGLPTHVVDVLGAPAGSPADRQIASQSRFSAGGLLTAMPGAAQDALGSLVDGFNNAKVGVENHEYYYRDTEGTRRLSPMSPPTCGSRIWSSA
jgi:hypothetical protein